MYLKTKGKPCKFSTFTGQYHIQISFSVFHVLTQLNLITYLLLTDTSLGAQKILILHSNHASFQHSLNNTTFKSLSVFHVLSYTVKKINMKQKKCVPFHSDLSVLSRYDHPFYHAAFHITVYLHNNK